ncbi:hypothetical protein BP00DRAFT_186337 [Aspergillus indologenus CBS 114.80]|uniref:Uncharacterized protein n=1 Tax=Aspergillus indologenus CBS 114.80 TaxID=1450541 RepID=A0A2V5J8A5_9EURO|nr:hypothetical protein BP00DRAFT_186337 [Aspergillus indologenus CBS 114.80]
MRGFAGRRIDGRRRELPTDKERRRVSDASLSRENWGVVVVVVVVWRDWDGGHWFTGRSLVTEWSLSGHRCAFLSSLLVS